MRYVYAFLVFAGIFLLIVPIAVPVIKTSADFSMFNTDWDGCSEFANVLADQGKLVPILYPYNSFDLKEESILIVVGPDISFSPLEIETVSKFLDKGGTLFLADDFGTANSLITGLGLNGSFYDKPLGDIFYDKSADFPVVARIEDPELSYGVDKLVLNIPSVITGLEGEVYSSKVSVIGEKRKSYPIMAETRYGAGKIIMLSDPDILINDMMKENKAFIVNLVSYLGSDSFYFDDAHHPDFNPYSVATIYIQRELDPGKAFIVFSFTVALLVFIETGLLRLIVRSIARFMVFRIYYPLLYILCRHIPRLSGVIQNNLMPARRGVDMFDELPEGVDIKILKRIIKEIRTGSKYDAGYEQGRRQRIYRKTKSRNW
jgi:hypothetical protein